MRESFRSLLFILVASTCLLSPSLMSAADPGTPVMPDPGTTAAIDPTTSGINISSGPNSAVLDLLVKKGILTSAEANSLRSSGSGGTEQLLLLLQAKGLLSESDIAAMKSAAPPAESMHLVTEAVSGGQVTSASLTAGQTPQAKPAEPVKPTVIPAIAPVWVLPLGPPKKDGLLGFKLGSGATMSPYGFIKATSAYDSSQPRGDDFPIPEFVSADTGPNNNPEYHIKARATRFGSKFEWPDVSKNVTITGQIEADFEGNFSRVDNRNVSTIRSNALQLRLAFGRIDWSFKPNTDFFFEAGQDWTIFGSSALMNLFETTFYGAYWGNVYERAPQMRVGFVQNLGGSRNFKLSPEFAIMTPAEGNTPADITTCTVKTLGVATTCTVTDGTANQLGYGERQGADNGKPEIESRVVLQFQLDKAPGVVPAQILWSGFYAGRQATVLGSAVPAAYKTAFPDGVDNNSNGYGNQIAISLPTRWATVVASGYMGADLRFFFGGQLLSNYNYTGGLSNLASAPSVDASSTVFFGTNAAGQSVVAPQKAVRGYGGFIQVGFPISRWFNAEPKGRNAGWQAYFEYGLDAANANDFRYAKDIGATTGAGPIKSSIRAVTVFYKMNPWVQFGFEESHYESYALPDNNGVCTTKIAGKPTCSAVDWRTEFGPVFTF